MLDRKLLFSICILTAMLLASCAKENKTQIPPTTPEDTIPPVTPKLTSGVALSFDDAYVDQWVAAHNEISKKYDWKATFFVSGTGSLTTTSFNNLKALKAAGHEIAGHGYMHRDARKYVADNGFDKYMEDEIIPMIDAMGAHDLSPTSFAYPQGAKTSSIDEKMLTTFKLLRGTTYRNSNPPEMLNCYYKFDETAVLYGLGIDAIYNNSTQFILDVLQHAKENNYVVILYGHSPVITPQTGSYQTSYEMINLIAQFIEDNNMTFYSFSELSKLTASVQ